MTTCRLLKNALPGRGWGRHLRWPVLIGLGWLIYELTHNLVLGGIALCLKFGVNDFRTARWLSRIDSDRGRAHSCFWLYLATGMYKVAISGIAVAVAAFLLFALLIRPDLPDPQGVARWEWLLDAALGALLATLGGLVLALALSYLALLWALRNRVKLWLDLGVYRARRENVWPSCYPASKRMNQAGPLIANSFLLPLVPVSCTALVGCPNLFRELRGWGILIAFGAQLFVCALWLCIFLWGAARLRHKVIARSPQECWGEPEYDEVGT